MPITMTHEITNTGELIEQTKNLLQAVRGSLIRVAQNLYAIKEQLPPEQNWGQYVEEEFGISQGFASKLLTVNRVYILEGGVSPEKLEGIDYERLYLAKDAGGTVDEMLAKAETLSRAELRAERQEAAPHPFNPKEICKDCGATRENHG